VSARVRVDGAAYSYLEQGEAGSEPVVLLHGYTGSHLSWRHQIPRLAERHRVIALDWLGWGDSDRPLSLRFDFDTEVARLGRVLDALGIERVNLCGHDYGGFLALGFALRRPGRIRRLALLATRAHRTFTPRWRAAFGLTSLGARAPAIRSLMARLPHEQIHRRSLRRELARGIIDQRSLDSYVGWMSGDPAGGRWLMRFFADYRVAPHAELRAGLGGISCPTAIVWGRRDPYLAPLIAEELAACIPGAELTMFDDAGHFVMEERPEETMSALTRLLARAA
jgi:cis-3-alkyl-4-acyloxetan-2-one decarboxylase